MQTVEVGATEADGSQAARQARRTSRAEGPVDAGSDGLIRSWQKRVAEVSVGKTRQICLIEYQREVLRGSVGSGLVGLALELPAVA